MTSSPPWSAESSYDLAFARFTQKRYAEALDMLTEQVSLQLPVARLLRARCLHHLARQEEAIAECRAHLAVAPDHADTNGLLALLLHEQAQNESAQAHVALALRANPQQLEAMLAVASMQSQAHEYDAARRSFDALLQVYPECGRGWLGLGLIKLAQLQRADARHDIELAATHMPDHIGTWHVLAWIHIMDRDVGAAEAALQRALTIDSTFAETHGGLAVIAALQGRESDARQSISRAFQLDPQSMSARYAEILLFQRYGQHGDAAAVLEAFLLRQVPERGGRQHWDLLNAQLRALRAEPSPPVDPVVRH